MSNVKGTVAITGATGFLGTALCEYFLNNGWSVVALSRSPSKLTHKRLSFRAYDLSKPVDKSILRGVDYLIHAAYVKASPDNPDAMTINIEGASNILDAALSTKVAHSVFISTMSAHDQAISIYGKQKLAIEDIFLKQRNATVIKSGLIIGSGGIVKEMANFMNSKHVIPLVDGGTQPLQIIALDDLAKSLEKIILSQLYGRFVVANPRVYSYRDFYTSLASHIGTKVAYIPVPYWLLDILFRTAATLGITLGVGQDNLKGLKKLISMPSREDMLKIGVDPLDLGQALKQSNLKY